MLDSGFSKSEEAYFTTLFNDFKQKQSHFIQGSEVFELFSKSGLSRDLLKEIWDISSSRKVGNLCKDEFFKGLKLISLAQNGFKLSEDNIYNCRSDLPRFKGIEIPNLPKHEEEKHTKKNIDDLLCFLDTTANEKSVDAQFQNVKIEIESISQQSPNLSLVNESYSHFSYSNKADECFTQKFPIITQPFTNSFMNLSSEPIQINKDAIPVAEPLKEHHDNNDDFDFVEVEEEDIYKHVNNNSPKLLNDNVAIEEKLIINSIDNVNNLDKLQTETKPVLSKLDELFMNLDFIVKEQNNEGSKEISSNDQHNNKNLEEVVHRAISEPAVIDNILFTNENELSIRPSTEVAEPKSNLDIFNMFGPDLYNEKLNQIEPINIINFEHSNNKSKEDDDFDFQEVEEDQIKTNHIIDEVITKTHIHKKTDDFEFAEVPEEQEQGVNHFNQEAQEGVNLNYEMKEQPEEFLNIQTEGDIIGDVEFQEANLKEIIAEVTSVPPKPIEFTFDALFENFIESTKAILPYHSTVQHAVEPIKEITIANYTLEELSNIDSKLGVVQLSTTTFKILNKIIHKISEVNTKFEQLEALFDDNLETISELKRLDSPLIKELLSYLVSTSNLVELQKRFSKLADRLVSTRKITESDQPQIDAEKEKLLTSKIMNLRKIFGDESNHTASSLHIIRTFNKDTKFCRLCFQESENQNSNLTSIFGLQFHYVCINFWLNEISIKSPY